jgi:HEAT repeat protein
VKLAWHDAGSCISLCLSIATIALAGCRTLDLPHSIADKDSSQKKPSAREDLLKGLAAPNVQTRLAAIESWQTSQPGELPPELHKLRTDPDPRVRAAAITAISVAAQHALAQQAHGAADHAAEAFAAASAAVSDIDLQVRLAAVRALGKLQDPKARQELERIVEREGEVLRAAAVAALAELGADDGVLSAATDKSWHVRREVARALALRRDPRWVEVAHRLVVDPSLEVQQAAVEALASWPRDQAAPLLLEAVESAGLHARQEAQRQLAQVLPAASQFPVDSLAEARQAAAQHLRQQLGATMGAIHGDVAAEARRAADELLDAARIDPKREAIEEALAQLASADLAERRRAAEALRDQAQKAAWSQSQLARLADIAAADSDPQVWRSVLSAIDEQASEPAFRLVYAALSHPAPDIRRRAAEHLARHAHPRHAAVLRAALADPDVNVVRAAVRAYGRTGAAQNLHVLEQLLAARDGQVRVAAAEALTLLGSEAGPAALERLARDLDVAVRRQAAVAMGNLADPQFAATLVSLLDDHGDVRAAALASLPKVAAEPSAGSTPRAGENPGLQWEPSATARMTQSEQIAYWKRWHAHERSR